MFRKSILIATLGFFAAATLVVSPANAVSNGGACTKAGSTQKTAGKKYICGKNPFVTPTKKTWTRVDCLDSYDQYLQIRDDLIPQSKDQLGLMTGDANATASQQKLIKDFEDTNVQVLAHLKGVLCKKGK